MTQPRDIERLLDQWFADGSSVAPDRVIDIVADRIERQPQRPAWRLDWRHLTINPLAKAGVAIAALVLIALVGYNLLPGNRSGVGGTGPTAVPTASPTAAPSTAEIAKRRVSDVVHVGQQLRRNRVLAAGSHATRLFQPAVTYTVPAGWVNYSDATYFGLFPDTPANQAEFARSGETADRDLDGVS